MKLKILPTTLEALHGLRAAGWVRESTIGQYDNFGPAAQREQIARAIARFGLAPTGIEWVVSHSGRTVAATAEWQEMLARAGGDYDVLVVGYASRFARDARTAFNTRHELHARGAALLFADERLLGLLGEGGGRGRVVFPPARPSRPRGARGEAATTGNARW